MRPEDFAPHAPGKVIRVGRGQAAYWAFLPDPLPPRLTYTSRLIRLVAQASHAVGELAGLGRTLHNPWLLVQPFLRQEAVLSSRIEGTEADLADVYAYEAGVRRGLPPDVREVHNYVRALQHGLERLETLPVSLRLLREMHAILLEGVRGEHATPGEFRRTQNWIGPPGCTLNEATYVPPPPDHLMEALDAWEKYLHAQDDHPPLVRLAFIHYQFEAIHPFLDGNGRIGRLLLILLLVDWGLLPLPLLYLSAYFERHRDAYYDGLLRVSTEGAWEDWVAFFLQGVVEQAQDALGRMKRLQDLRLRWRKLVTHKRASANLLKLVDVLFEKPVLTIPDAAQRLQVTYRSAQRLIHQLVDSGILQPYGRTGGGRGKPGQRYAVVDVLAVLDIPESKRYTSTAE